MNKSAPTLGRILVIAGFSLSCFGLLVFLFISFGGTVPLQPKGYRFQVAFTDATQLATQADVRVAGVRIGKVVGKRLAPQGNETLATVELEPRYAPLRSDARAVLRQKTLLGETYVEMTLGNKRAPPIKEGGRLPDANVAQAVEFDELLRIFDPATRTAFRQWQASTAQAGAGRSRDLSDALGNLPVFAENAQDVVSVLRRRREALGSLIRGTGATFEQLTRNETALQGVITNSDQVFGTLSARRESLAASIQAFPTFLQESRRTLARLSRFSRSTTPLIRDLGPVLHDAQPTLASLRRVAPDLNDLFGNLRPLIRAGNKGLPALSRVLRGLDPTLASLGPLLAQVNPILEYLEANQATVSDFLGEGPGALALKLPTAPGSGSTGHALPQLVMLGDQTQPTGTRSKDNRGNAYFPPGSLADPRQKSPSKFIAPNFDCANAGGPKAPTDTPGCFVAPDVTFGGKTQHFPNVVQALPGGVSRNAR